EEAQNECRVIRPQECPSRVVRTKLVYLVIIHTCPTSGNQVEIGCSCRRDYDPGVTPGGTKWIKPLSNEQVMADTAEVSPFEQTRWLPRSRVLQPLWPPTEVVGGDRLRSPASAPSGSDPFVPQRGTPWYTVVHRGTPWYTVVHRGTLSHVAD